MFKYKNLNFMISENCEWFCGINSYLVREMFADFISVADPDPDLLGSETFYL